LFADKTHKWNHATVTSDMYEHADTGDVDDAVGMTFTEVFDEAATLTLLPSSSSHVTDTTQQTTPGGTAPAPGGTRTPAEMEQDRKWLEMCKATFIAGNKAHGEFDRKRRDFNSLVLRSMAAHKPGTAELAKAVQLLVENGEQLDADFEAVQAKYQSGGKIAQKEIDEVKVYSVDMYKLCKDGVSKCSALKSCLSAF
jgi:hypothetical protein